MSEVCLRKLTLSDKQDFTSYLTELVLESGATKGVSLEDGLSFEALLEYYNKSEKIPFNSYEQKEFPFKQYILVREKDKKIVGAVNIRPHLTRVLSDNFEGNIGYSVRPSERGKGYGKRALELALTEFFNVNDIDDVIICCYKENLPSRKIIEKQGGILIEECTGILSPQKYLIKRKG